MRLTPLIIPILLLISPCSILAATGNLSVTYNPLDAIGNPVSVNTSANITANHTDYIPTTSQMQTQTQSSDASSESMGE